MRRYEADRINDICNSALTVGQLRAALKHLDQDAPVFFTCNYGDYHRTEQALPLCDPEEYTREDLESSAYSHSGLAVVDSDDLDERHEDPEEESDDDDCESHLPVVLFRFGG